ncbi:MAG: DUF1003 domain-containing protein [Anaerolineae bacterium]
MSQIVPHYEHDHAPVRNANDLEKERLTLGMQTADVFARVIGSWRFIIIQSVILVFWMILNVAAWIEHWDPYPFILLNLVLSFQAAFAGPIIMMSQNRQNEKDRLAAQLDYEINVKAEEEIKVMLQRIEESEGYILEVLMRLKKEDEKLINDLGQHPPAEPHGGVGSSSAG